MDRIPNTNSTIRSQLFEYQIIRIIRCNSALASINIQNSQKIQNQKTQQQTNHSRSKWHKTHVYLQFLWNALNSLYLALSLSIQLHSFSLYLRSCSFDSDSHFFTKASPQVFNMPTACHLGSLVIILNTAGKSSTHF